jgi:prepilin-type N-terminal cleavage/methylation domain-containing protein
MMFRRGFTLIEVLIVMGLFVLLLAFVVPIGLSFYQSQITDETALELASAFDRARSDARLGKSESAYGIKVLSDRYVLFRGDSYATRVSVEDMTTMFPGGTVVTASPSEYVFSKLDAFASATGTVNLIVFGKTHTVSVDKRVTIAN